MKKAFVIGFPIAHSLSPQMHSFWLNKYGIEGSYEPLEVPAEYLAKTVKKLPETYIGGNVTIPHKEKALMLCTAVEEMAREVGAVNTLAFENGKIYGANTDVYGFTESLKAVNFKPTRALVVGAGGASRAIMVGLKQLGAKVYVTNRTMDTAQKFAKEFGATAIEWNKKEGAMRDIDYVVNATALGMKGKERLDINLSGFTTSGLVHDIVYNPIETDFLREAKELGIPTLDGLSMLMYQAAPGFEIWFGKRPEVNDELKEHLIKCL